MSNAIRTLQAVTTKQNIQDKADAREDKQGAIDDAKSSIDQVHAQRVKKAEEEAQAIRDEFGGRFWGTIIGGPLIGTLVGWGIGAACSNDNDDAAAAAEKKAGFADLERAKADDAISDATEGMDNADSREAQVDRLMKEIRKHDSDMAHSQL